MLWTVSLWTVPLAAAVFLFAHPALAQSPPGGALVVVLGSAPATLDPLLATDANGVRISHQLIHQTLVRLDDSLEIVPGVAQWKRLSPTGYRFTLSRGARFHNGAPLDAKDAVHTLRRFMDPTTASPYGAGLREKISAIKATGPLTFRVDLKAPFSSFLADLVLPVISRRDPPGTGGGTALNGSGPFRLAGRSVGNIELERDPNHPRPAGLARVVFKVVKDENTRLLKFRKRDVHLGINVMPLDKLSRFARPPLKSTYRLMEAPGLSYQYLGFNLDDPLLGRREVRRALAHAINVDLLISHRQKGHSTRATGVMPPGSPFADPSVKPPSFDPARARALLDRAGLPLKNGRRFSLTYKTSTDRSAIFQARVIQSDLRKVGIELQVRSYEWATFYADIKKGNFQLYSLRWIGVSDPGFLYELLHSSKRPPRGRNRGGYANREVDALLERARVEPDPDRRRALYRRVQRRVHADLPFMSMWHNNNVAVVHRRLTGFRLHPSGGFEHLAEASWGAP